MGIPTKVPIDLINPTPAASTDLSDYVTLDTNQSITGSKSFNDIYSNRTNDYIRIINNGGTNDFTHPTTYPRISINSPNNSTQTGEIWLVGSNGTSSNTLIVSPTEVQASNKFILSGDHASTEGLVITGNKQNRALIFQSTDLTKGTAPSSICTGGIEWYGDNRSGPAYRTACIDSSVDTSNTSAMYLRIYSTTTATSNPAANISLSVNSSGTVSTSAPTPPTSDNSTQIATTAFVNNRLSDIESKLEYIGVSTDLEGESTPGNKLGIVSKSISSNEGGQIVLQRGSASYYNTIIDQYNNQFRIFQNAAANGRMFKINFVDNDTNIDCNGGKVEVIMEKSIGQNGYIRYYSGLQLAWGQVTIAASTASSGVVVTFTKAFTSEPRLFLQESYVGGPYSYIFTEQPVSRSATGFTYYVSKWNGTAMSWDNGTVNYLAIGPWK